MMNRKSIHAISDLLCGRNWLGALFLLVVATTLVAWAPEVSAYQLYSGSDKDTATGSCANCHGAFNGPNYTSLMDSSNWNANLMAGHEDSVLGASDCNVCHTSGKKGGNTFLNISSGGVGLPAIGCVGCHGRTEDDIPGNPEPAGSGTGAGLRQLHFNANLGGFTDENSNPITTQICADCHADADPANYTPVDENVLPPYYPLVDLSPVDGIDDNYPLKPTDSCNGNPAPHNENKFGAFGLDHDGDGLVDSNDPGCAGNTPPVANDDSDTVAEGNSVVIAVLANDTDADGTLDPATVSATNGANGTTSVNTSTGEVTYTHDGSETVSDSFTYTVQDNLGATSNTATVNITVTPVNDPPVANNDSDTVAEGGSVPINVLANDTDADGTVDATTVTIITDVTNGSTSVNPTTGVVTYTHDGSETTSDSFTYTVQDNLGATSNTGTVNITVTPVNDPPVANDDADTVAEGASVVIAVLANDTDVDGTLDPATVSATNGANGTTSVNTSTGEVTYTHNGSETTSDSFTYTVQDNLGASSNTATVTITVTPVNDPPVANDDADTVAEGASVVIAVLANDTDVDGTLDPATVSATNGANGTTSVNPTTGEVTYTHDGSETTSDSFTYTVNDNNGATSNTATVTITVTPVNDPPVANDDAGAVAEGGSTDIAVLANDTDADGSVNATTVTIISDVTNGSTAVNPTTGVVTYTHDGSQTTSDSFTYTVQDDQGATSNTATVTITVTAGNVPPVANDDADTVAEGASVVIAVLANDTDVDGTLDPATVSATNGANGTTSVNTSTGEVTYTHNGSETTSDSFTYTVQDNLGATSNTATVNITVTPVNDPPVANDDADTVAEGASVVIAVLANDTDVDGTLNPATVSATNGANGTTSVNTSTGEVTYTHDGSETTSDSFTYTVQDNLGATSNTATVNITVTPVNDPPVANDDSATVAEGASVVIAVLANDTDVDGTLNPATVSATNGANGTTSVNTSTGEVTYTHDGSQTTSDSFTYTVQDDQGATSNTATVTITVTAGNVPPVANDDADTVAEGGSVPIDVLANDTDADGTIDATTVTIVTDVTNGSTAVNPTTGVVTYTHGGSATVSDSFTYTVNDDQAATSNIATVSITVTAVVPDQATNLWFHNIGSTAMTLFWSEGTGDGSIVVMKQGSAVDATLVDGTEHVADSVFGAPSAALGGGNFVVYRGNGESVHVTGLSFPQTYHVAVYTYTGAGTSIEYLLPDPAIGNEATLENTPHNVAILNIDDTVTCTTGCHGGHGSALVPRGSDQETACVSCHNADSGVPGASALTNFSLHTNSYSMPPATPGVVDCGSCHELHNPVGDDTTYTQNPITSLWDYNLHYLRANPQKYVPTALPWPANNLVAHADTNSEDWAFENGAAYQGTCQVCHTKTSHYRNSAFDDIHQGGDLGNVDCRGCHDHGGNFAGAGGDCTQCHNKPQGSMPRRIVTTEFSGGNIVSSHLTGTLDAADCEVCHNHATGSAHKTGKVNLYNADTGAAIELATRTDPRGSQADSETLTTFCLSCHDSNGANGNTSPFTTAGTTVDIQSSIREHTNDGTGSVSCFGDGNFGCHGSGHGGQKLAILAPAESGPGALPDLTDENETFCLNCHDGGTPVLTPAAPDILGDLGGSFAVSVEKVQADSNAWVNQNHDILPADKDWSLANGGVRPTITCSDCHLPPHDATAGSPVKNPDTGLTFTGTYNQTKTWTYLDRGNPVVQTYQNSSGDQSPITPEGMVTPHDSTDYVEFCLTCHDGDPPPGIVMSANLLDIAAAYAIDYHGAAPNGGTGTSINRGGMKAPWTTGGDSKNEDPSAPYAAFPCTMCHGPHGSGSIFNLRTSITIAGKVMSTGSFGTGDPMDSIIGTVYELPKFGPGGTQENRVWGAWCTFCHQLSAHSYSEDQVCRSGHQHGGGNF